MSVGSCSRILSLLLASVHCGVWPHHTGTFHWQLPWVTVLVRRQSSELLGKELQPHDVKDVYCVGLANEL